VASLLANMRSELKIMNTLYIHDIIERSEQVASLLANMRSELKIMNTLYIHDITGLGACKDLI
jgi:hypothetical protein